MKLPMHQLMSYNVDVLAPWTDHDTRAATDHLRTPVAIKLEWTESTWSAKEDENRLRLNFAEGGFNSRAGVASELNVAPVIGF